MRRNKKEQKKEEEEANPVKVLLNGKTSCRANS
jgi:predicted GTPase